MTSRQSAPVFERLAAKVFAEIPEYKEILSRQLTPSDPDYWILLQKANEKFHNALWKVAPAKALDLVGEKGAIQAAEGAPLPDITADVIKALPQ